jgi:hypothetical protein
VERGRVRMPERVTTRRVGSPSAESTRFPGEGQSAQGQSGPKARPKGVADGQAVNIPPPAARLMRTGRHRLRDRGDRRPRPARATAFDPEVSLQVATKSRLRTNQRPVPQSDTGVLGEHPKAFGRTLVKELGKMTPYLRYKGCSPHGEPQRIGSSDCLSKTQDSANSQEDV